MTEYRWVDKDPIIDIIRTAYDRAGRPSLSYLEHKCGGYPRAQTISRLLYGGTKKPMNWTVGRLLEALDVDTTARWADTMQPVVVNHDAIRALVREHMRKVHGHNVTPLRAA